MFYFKGTAYAKVWNVERKEKYTSLRFSTSEKDQNGDFRYSSWFGRAIGHAHNALANVKQGDRIIINACKLTNEGVKDEQGNIRSYLNVVILDAKIADGVSAPAPQAAPAQATPAASSTALPIDDDENLPF